MGGWQTPDSLAPDNAHVRRLIIPGDMNMLANVNGALLELTYPESWEKFGDVEPEDAANACFAMYLRFQTEIWGMIGAIVPAITADTPPGCLECDGATYDTDDYPDLAAVIHGVWDNGDGTFTVPDLRGKFPLGASTGHTMGSTGGAETVTLGVGEMPAHAHSTGNSLTSAAVMPGEGPVLVPNPIPASTGSTGGDGSHQNMPPFVALRYVLIAF